MKAFNSSWRMSGRAVVIGRRLTKAVAPSRVSPSPSVRLSTERLTKRKARVGHRREPSILHFTP